MFVVLALTVAVAAFNLVSTLVMTVSEKRAEIAILQTLGMTRERIVTVFFLHGGLIGIVGITVGVLGGIILANNISAIIAFIEQLFHFKFLSPEVYYISDIPSDLRSRDVVIAAGISIALCLLAPIYPALAASRIAPAEALRYE